MYVQLRRHKIGRGNQATADTRIVAAINTAEILKLSVNYNE